MTSVAHLESSMRLGAATAAKDAQTLLHMGDKSLQLLQMYNYICRERLCSERKRGKHPYNYLSQGYVCGKQASIHDYTRVSQFHRATGC